MIREAIALLVPACAIWAILPPFSFGLSQPARLAAFALAVCLGIGFSSITTVGFILAGIGPGSSGFVASDALMWTIVGVVGWYFRRTGVLAAPTGVRTPTASVAARGPIDWIVRLAFGATTLVALAAVAAAHRASPHGEWDAWAIWNLHARFLFRGGDEWRTLFQVDWSQPAYPLLLPASVARVWAYAGHETTLGPALVALAFVIATVMLVMTALDLNRRRAWIAGSLLIGAGGFLAQVSSQCADVPLACFIVATLPVACGRKGVLIDRDCPHVMALAGGATSAMGAWTKNEGLVFALLMLTLVAGVAWRRGAGRRLLWWIAGGAPVVVTIVWFKWVSPPGSLIDWQSLGSYVTRAFDLDRHLVAAALMAQHAVRWSAPFAVSIIPLVSVVAVWLAVVRGGMARRVMLVLISLMLATYYVIYLTTPFDIAWHVSTSFDRLLVQLWPALVLTVFFEDPTLNRLKHA